MTEFERQCQERARILGQLQGLAEAQDPRTAAVEGVVLLVEYLRLIGAGDLVEAFCAINLPLPHPSSVLRAAL